MLKIESLYKSFTPPRRSARESAVIAIDSIDLEVAEGEMFTLLGPSGCGKTTTLRCVAGLETPTSGRISINGDAVFDSADKVAIPPNRRRIGMVFQSYAIWPHLSVYDNAAFPLQVARKSRSGETRLRPSEMRDRVLQALDAVGLGGIPDRRATNLSGGQQQRLALARAMVMKPRILLLDEPLSNLDAKLREQMRFELKRIQRELGITTLYVTHDQAEALSMSDRIAIMKDGQIVQMGRPEDVYTRPESEFVAAFLGNANIIPGELIEFVSSSQCRVETSFGTASGVMPAGLNGLRLGDKVLLTIRPEAVNVRPDDAGHTAPLANSFRGLIEGRAYLGDVVENLVVLGDTQLRVRRAPRALAGSSGGQILVDLPIDHCLVIPRDDTTHGNTK